MPGCACIWLSLVYIHRRGASLMHGTEAAKQGGPPALCLLGSLQVQSLVSQWASCLKVLPAEARLATGAGCLED